MEELPLIVYALVSALSKKLALILEGVVKIAYVTTHERLLQMAKGKMDNIVTVDAVYLSVNEVSVKWLGLIKGNQMKEVIS